MKESSKVSQRDIKNLPNGVHKIDTNFYIRVRGDYRNYIFKATIDGKRREIGLGSAYEVPFNVAKAKALKLKSQIASGEELFVDELKTEKEADKPKKFSDIAEDAIKATQKSRVWKSEKHAHQWRQTINDYAVPIFNKKKIDDLTRKDVLMVLDPIWETKTETARRLLNRLEVIFEYAIREGVYTHPNPARWKGNLEFDLPMPSKIMKDNHMSAMTIDEARELTNKFRDSECLSHKAILFGMMTACRVQEFLRARWDEIDFEKRVFVVSPDRRKDGKKYPHRVPLSTQAIDLLKSIEKRGDLIFLNEDLKPMAMDTPRMILQKNMDRKVTMHGCRSTFRDWCAENGIDRVLAEKSLMHSVGNEVEQAYQRSDLLEQRRSIMQKWANFLLP